MLYYWIDKRCYHCGFVIIVKLIIKLSNTFMFIMHRDKWTPVHKGTFLHGALQNRIIWVCYVCGHPSPVKKPSISDLSELEEFILSWQMRAPQGMSFILNINPLPNDKVLDETKFKATADDKLNNKKIIFLSLIEYNTLWEKEKMLVISIFSFSRNVFKSLVSKGHQRCHYVGMG